MPGRPAVARNPSFVAFCAKNGRAETEGGLKPFTWGTRPVVAGLFPGAGGAWQPGATGPGLPLAGLLNWPGWGGLGTRSLGTFSPLARAGSIWLLEPVLIGSTGPDFPNGELVPFNGDPWLAKVKPGKPGRVGVENLSEGWNSPISGARRGNPGPKPGSLPQIPGGELEGKGKEIPWRGGGLGPPRG